MRYRKVSKLNQYAYGYYRDSLNDWKHCWFEHIQNRPKYDDEQLSKAMNHLWESCSVAGRFWFLRTSDKLLFVVAIASFYPLRTFNYIAIRLQVRKMLTVSLKSYRHINIRFNPSARMLIDKALKCSSQNGARHAMYVY